MIYNLEDTICAQSTPSGRGGIHVIRVSGKEAVNIVDQIFTGFPQSLGTVLSNDIGEKVKNKLNGLSKSAFNNELEEEPGIGFKKRSKFLKSHSIYYGYIFNPKTKSKVDEVLVSFFEAGKSFTNEETIEISCHGNPVLVRMILEGLIASGCRMADRGEFTYRAYKNKRLNLAQAEAVLSLIESKNESSIAKSLKLLDGDFFSCIKEAEEDLIWSISRLEARIDFSAEDIEIESLDTIRVKLADALKKLTPLIKNFRTQNILNQGVKTLILGPPNVGKSSLMNALLGRQRSIVSEVAGTTRDFVSESLNLEGKSFEIIDTAGLRESDDSIEKLGIEKVYSLLELSDLVIFQLDYDHLKDFDKYYELVKEKKHLIVINKSDELEDNAKKDVFSVLSSGLGLLAKDKVTFISALKNEGLDLLKNKMVTAFELSEEEQSLEVVSLRQEKAISETIDSISEGIKTLDEFMSDEFILSHLNESLMNLLSLSFIDNDEIVRDKIFKDFCLGK